MLRLLCGSQYDYLYCGHMSINLMWQYPKRTSKSCINYAARPMYCNIGYVATVSSLPIRNLFGLGLGNFGCRVLGVKGKEISCARSYLEYLGS